MDRLVVIYSFSKKGDVTYAYQLARFHNYASLVLDSKKEATILNSCELRLSFKRIQLN